MAGAIVTAALVPCAQAADHAEQVHQGASRLMAKDATWSLRLPKDDKVAFKGVANFDQAGAGSLPMLYPAPNAAGLLAAVITHAVIADSAQTRQKNQLQEAADKVLLPYQAVLSTYSHKDLMQKGLEKTMSAGSKKLVEFSEKPGADWFIESTPVFSITQDHSAIILENAVSVYRPNAPAAAAYENIVKVISHASSSKDLAVFWTANEGEKLKEESASLFAHSLDVAMSEAALGPGEGNAPHKTFRYFEGSVEKMERGQLVSERCNRVVIRNLRGWLMSIPAGQGAISPAAGQCGPGGAK